MVASTTRETVVDLSQDGGHAHGRLRVDIDGTSHERPERVYCGTLVKRQRRGDGLSEFDAEDHERSEKAIGIGPTCLSPS